MTVEAQSILTFFESFSSEPISHFEQLPKSGGDRIYFRITTPIKSYIATYNENEEENKAFLNFTSHFKSKACPVPEIFKVHADGKKYLQQDFGSVSLLHELEKQGPSDYVFGLFQKSLMALANMQIKGHENFNYDNCLTSKEFGKKAILNDLLYFKYYFLDTLKIPYDKEKLMNDFILLSNYLTQADHKYFMYRDFQSRNIYVQNEVIHFIDYQGGMNGALQYDVASLLWQARANLSEEWKNALLGYYMDCVDGMLPHPINRSHFTNEYNGYVLIRLLQVLGAYGFRGLFERKAQFLTSIPQALYNLKWFLENKKSGIALDEFERVLLLVVEEEIINRFKIIQADNSTPLIVTINSFSFLKTGYPKEESNNGGGYVFDCRGILNPGRFEAYKTLTGRDRPVIEFLEQRTTMPDYLNSVYNMVDLSVEDYIQRKFASLTINFGCTGGQHRSVYAAEMLTKYLHNKFKVKIRLNHIEQDIHEQKGFDQI